MAMGQRPDRGIIQRNDEPSGQGNTALEFWNKTTDGRKKSYRVA